jgi:hypothetical protein
MVTPLNRFIAVVGTLSIIGSIGLVLYHSEQQTVKNWAHVAPPASDALVQSVDLSRIEGFQYVNDRTLNVTDDLGRHFKMELTEECPGLKDAKDFSLVTESFHNFDRFTAIGVQGSICTFKDFAPLPEGAPAAPAP